MMLKRSFLSQSLLLLCFITLFTYTEPKPKPPQFKFTQKAHMIPHPDKAHRGGEDAFYSGQNLLVVADGVGGWNAQGVDPSQYSRFLCSASSSLLR